MPPEEDPLKFLLECNISEMTDEQLNKYVADTHTVVNEPRALSKMLSGKVRKKKGPSAKTAAQTAALSSLMDSL